MGIGDILVVAGLLAAPIALPVVGLISVAAMLTWLFFVWKHL